MKSVIPTVLMIVGITIMTAIGVCMICFQAQVSAAENAHAEAMATIQAGAGDPSVVSACAADVRSKTKNGRLYLKPAGRDAGGETYLVCLQYTADLPIFQLSRQGTIQGVIHT